ncbi:mRNA splicing factor [Plasmopara halstedii]|uniref:mRNA splicing factor n=1 Tax=Plasmopara halstedii TaxID=4781 RepID=A0A0P1B0W2_PLAHL|nr:mRNA splicing factor [Plasmopara halstedii]CEG47685.1 mRNA splicing factor [Plasmopara halstedii]|eukprot:XP_024584054.1 mRNA splicing factor [Plasmopara halstedii]
MDLYANLPLAKGAKASSALDADGKPKTSLTSANSVWASTPLMVPQAAKNKKTSQPSAVVTSSTLMLPTALTAGRGKSPLRSTTPLAFKPATLAREVTTVNTACLNRQEEKTASSRFGGRGLGYVAATEVKVTLAQHQQKQEKEMDVDLIPEVGQFFQATYRDEYHPARPNSYEVFCKDREDRKKMEKVKKELSRRQKEQEREGKLEREQLVKDLAEGRAPAIKLPAPAGRGRGMTMPAWMRKKIEENASVVASQPESEREDDWEYQLKTSEKTISTIEGQFEDALDNRGGLGCSNRGLGLSSSELSSTEVSKEELSSPSTRLRGNMSSSDNFGRDMSGHDHLHRPLLHKNGNEIHRESRKNCQDGCDKSHIVLETNFGSYDSQRHNRFISNEIHSSSEKRRRVSGWDKSSQGQPLTSRVVLLQNMVGPGEVDAELQDEVKEECSETYGPVTKCLIYEDTGKVSPEKAVRIFVQFHDADDATKALTGLNGRFFGGRKVKALYFDEGRFERMDLNVQ